MESDDIKEKARCTSLRLFLWSEKLTQNRISESVGLCVFVIRSNYLRLHPCRSCPYDRECNIFLKPCCIMTISFDVSMLLNKDPSLGPILMAATLQFKPYTIEKIGRRISNCLFSRFQLQALLPPPRPTYVIAIEISHTCYIDYALHDPPEDIPGIPPPIQSLCRSRKDSDDHEELLSAANMNDPNHHYDDDVLEYIATLRDYTGEAGICPTKPPIEADVPSELVEVNRCNVRVQQPLGNCRKKDLMEDSCRKRDLMDDTCPVCFQDFKDKNEVITTTYCSHEFHTRCLQTWLYSNNTCPTCRADYPLHYSASLNPKRRKPGA